MAMTNCARGRKGAQGRLFYFIARGAATEEAKQRSLKKRNKGRSKPMFTCLPNSTSYPLGINGNAGYENRIQNGSLVSLPKLRILSKTIQSEGQSDTKDGQQLVLPGTPSRGHNILKLCI
jgi:hypothetical protein